MISEGCPTWCVTDHRARGEPHRSMSSVVPAVILDDDGVATSAELVVQLHRAPGEPVAWCYIGEGRLQRLELSVESAWRLGRDLLAALDRLGESPGGLSA